MAMSLEYRNKNLNYWFRKETLTVPDAYYIALSTTDPSINVTEPLSSSYSRLEVINDSTNWSQASGGVIKNATIFRFQQATESWNVAGTPIKYWAMFDTATDGSPIHYGALRDETNISDGNVFQIPVNGITISIIDIQ